MYLAIQRTEENNLTIAAHTQGGSLSNKGIVNEGITAERLDLPPVTKLVGTTQTTCDLLLTQKTGVRYHICHASIKTSAELVRLAKARGINVTCGVAPHRVLLTDSDIPKDNGYSKMSPSLRGKEDQAALLAGLLDGAIDLIATDHAPHAKKERQGGMEDAVFGITGSEAIFSTLYAKFVREEEVLRLEQLLTLLGDKPTEVFGIKNTGVLEPGKNAGITIFDIEHKTEIKEVDFKSKGVNTPFTGQKIYDETAMTLVDGKVVCQKGTK